MPRPPRSHNPRSGKGNGEGSRSPEDQKRPYRQTAIIDDFDTLPAMLAGFAGSGVDTCSSAPAMAPSRPFDKLAEAKPFARLPRLVLLPHGTTNMSAADLGLGITSLDEQARLITEPVAFPARRKAPARDRARRNARDGQIRHGMFVGAGVLEGTRCCRRR